MVAIQTTIEVGRRIRGLYTNLHTKVEDDVDTQLPVAPLHVVDDTTRARGVFAAHIGVEVALLLSGQRAGTKLIKLEELSSRLDAAVLGTEQGIALAVNACRLVGKQGTNGIALTTRIGRVLGYCLVEHLIGVETQVDRGGPAEVLGLDILRIQRDFPSFILHRCPVDRGIGKARLQWQLARTDEVTALTIVVVDAQSDAILQDGKV